MRILGIESSCDETGAAIVEDGTKILSNIVASSQELHIKTGGIIPEVASREQIKYIVPVINQALKGALPETLNSAPYVLSQIDAIAVTVGPGLIGSLLVGVETAKTLAYLWNKPIIPANHLLAHLYANWVSPLLSQDHKVAKQSLNLNSKIAASPTAPRNDESQTPSFPAVALIASGGHTDLLLIKNHGKIRWLGGTRDDAAGEAFDKIARLLELPYPGGPEIAAEATKLKTKNLKLTIKLPRPLMDADDFDFSFSGLKTAVLREVNNLKAKHYNDTYYYSEIIPSLAYEVQEAITDVLVTKTIRAAQKYRVKSILLGGGVVANERLREKMSKSVLKFFGSSVSMFVPPTRLCTDNAVVIASAAFFNYKPVPWKKIQAHPDLYFQSQ
ncbi:tRNA (adenosine(37)-N6)-threonylcarbamoyltransferase complex transferase subunit TsaD [Candidatus Microgenomates bacterium]|nr:tRNA (adenosine(37)-N6)-threonylcarbamoyltransferase complex transferase subunit TsaD [Candidatus Microgenomates bacterium]